MEQMSERIVMGGWRLEGKARYGEIVRGERQRQSIEADKS